MTPASGDGSDDAPAAAADADRSDGPPPEGTADTSTREAGLGRWRSREVEVPMRVYKTVTVFATLIAVVAVLIGFVLLDEATNRAQAALSDVDAVVALLGVASIVFGAAVYAFSTRFRTAGMGKPNSDDDETCDNG